MSNLYVGLMSGTSADGIDAALVDFTDATPKLIAASYTPYTNELREQILLLCQQGPNEIKRAGELDIILGKAFAHAVNALLKQHSLNALAIKAIGSHGQTIRHSPIPPHRFTMQIGDPNTIAAETGITTIADFRRRDIALGGQGAPLVPAFHQQVFASPNIDRAIVNIGGIANVTLLSQQHSEQVIGFDTGPGNTLMDAWISLHQNKMHDENGAWCAQGQIQQVLLEKMLEDKYFQLSAPKSTGREYFNLKWLQSYLEDDSPFSSLDIQTTLAELTARSILADIQKYISTGEILVCGGGIHNSYLMQRLQRLAAPNFCIASTETLGIHPDWVEAIAFAWLAKQTLNRQHGNLPSVTGASHSTILGGIYLGA